MTENLSLFNDESPGFNERSDFGAPLADRLRPAAWDKVCGVEEIFDPAFMDFLKKGQGRAPSLVLWGPPGTGKTTIARLVGKSFKCNFIELSAVLAGVKEIRDVVQKAERAANPTILFIDEIHRFNKAQQDALLPHIESGTLSFIGATTENPSFYLNSALLSRVKVIVLKPLSERELLKIAERAIKELDISVEHDALLRLCKFACGDARQLLNSLEGIAASYGKKDPVTVLHLETYLKNSGAVFYDRDGEEHYNLISAFIKSLRGSDPDAALYWCFRMIEAGEDPRFIIRRMICFASEDIGNAAPYALTLAVSTYEAFERIGMPEGRIPIAQCVTYLASAPKSNRSYQAMLSAIKDARDFSREEVPLHLRNAPTGLMKSIGYGKDYRYPHDNERGYVPGEQYLPEALRGRIYYRPSEHGHEREFKKRLEEIRSFKK